MASSLSYGTGVGKSKKFALLIAIGALVAFQLIACSEQAGDTKNEGDAVAAKESTQTASGATELTYPTPAVSQNQALPSALLSTKQKGEKKSKPDFFLVWLKLYEPFIPKQILDFINSNVRPQTEQISGQVLDQVPGAEEYWSQLSGLLNTVNNMGGLQSVLSGASGGSSNPLSGLMESFGRRRR